MFAQKSMRERYVFTDVQLRGYYPSYVLNEWERRGFNIKMEDGDLDVLREGDLRLSRLQLLHDQRGEGRRRHRRCDLWF